jgi:WD40 repeat protein
MLSVGFSPDGNYIGLGGETPTLSGPYFTLLDHTTPGTVSLATTYNTSRVVRSLDFSLNGSYVATAHSDAPYFTLLNRPTASTLSLAATYTGVAQGNGTAFSPDGNYIVLLCAGASNQIALLDHTTPGSVSLSATYTTSSSAQKAKFTPSGNYIAVANQATGGAPQFTLLSHNAGSIALAASYVLAGNAIDVSISPV